VTPTQRIAWLRIGAESLAIVTSILLAFAIDAWWQSRNDRATEQDILVALLEEFEQNEVLLAQARAEYETAYMAAIRLLEYLDKGSADIPASEFQQLIDGVLMQSGIYLESGAYDSLMASGRLDLIQDEALRNRLAAWPSYLAEWTEEVELDFGFVNDVLIPYISRSVRIRNVSDLFEPFPDGQPPPPVPVGPNETGSLQSTIDSLEFDNLVTYRALHTWYAIRDGETLRAQVAIILDLIGQNLDVDAG
jgi:hypothetical protein